MKKLFLILIVFIPVFSSAQYVDLSIGYSTSNLMIFDLGYYFNNKVYLGADFGSEIFNGTSGEDYTGTIGWNEFPEDVFETGEYTSSVINGCLGLRFNRVLLSGVMGVAFNSFYQNRYDASTILGENGDYYVTEEQSNSKFNIGGKMKMFLGSNSNTGFSIGLKATSVEGVGFLFGAAF